MLAHRSVIHPRELRSTVGLGACFFAAGIGVYLWVVLAGFAVPILSGWYPPPIFVAAVVLSGIGSPWLLLFTLRSQVRTSRRACGLGAAGGLGIVVPAAVFSIGNPDVRQWVGVGVAALAVMLFYGAANAVLLAILNRLRPPPPLQDGTLCPGCGYCLIGNTSLICSECGRPFTREELSVRSIDPFDSHTEEADLGSEP